MRAMGNRRYGKRPNRRQLDPTNVNVSPLALQYATPGVLMGNTVISAALTQYDCAVDNVTGGPEVASIRLTGLIDGSYQTVPANSIANGGEDGAGTLVDLVFTGELDTTQPWLLQMPSYTPLIQSRYGGKLVGALSIGETTTTANYGFVSMGNQQDGPFPFPVLMVPWTATVDDATHISVQLDSTSYDPLTLAGVPPISDSSAGAAVGAVDNGNGNFTLEFGGGAVAGSQLTIPQWMAEIRGPARQYMAPARLTTV